MMASQHVIELPVKASSLHVLLGGRGGRGGGPSGPPAGAGYYNGGGYGGGPGGGGYQGLNETCFS